MKKKELKKLIDHGNNPIYEIKTKEVPGKDRKCYFCNGEGKGRYSDSDCSYNSWSYLDICHVCDGTGKTETKSYAIENDYWFIKIGPGGGWLEHRVPETYYLTLEEAEASINK